MMPVSLSRPAAPIELSGPSESIADAIKVQQLGDLVFPLVQTYVDDIETVSEAEIARATTHAWSSLKLIVEPGGGGRIGSSTSRSRASDG